VAAVALEINANVYESNQLTLSNGMFKNSPSMAMNPSGQVPILKDGDTVIYESIAILACLDRSYPQSTLFAETA